MCGIAGVLTTPDVRADARRSTVERMTAALAHRGPDDVGYWADEAAGVALGFRRLSIIDLSPAGHQPMGSASGRFTMVFNGEVYNFQELRRELEQHGVRFRGHSDSEVMLAAFERWGFEPAVRRFIGMFAIAVWDHERRALHLVRDRLGKKPLFVFARPGTIAFGSELKALVAVPGFDGELNRDAVAAYLRYLYVPAPLCIYRYATKVLPGHIVTVTDPARPLPAPTPYWSVEEVARRGLADPFSGSEGEAVQELDRLLGDAVELRLQADVPLGALLSGGIDSSTVVSLMRERARGPVRTFTIGFDQPEYDEAPSAAAVAAHLGTEHTALHVSGADALAVVPRLPMLFDEPFADPSQIPTFLVCELARRHVTVALTGDGGDELFAGYNRYTQGRRLLDALRRVPRAARRPVAAALAGVSADSWERASGMVRTLWPALPGGPSPGGKLAKLAPVVDADSAAAMYRALVSAWQEPKALVHGGAEPAGTLERIVSADEPSDLLDRMMLADQATYLADDLLAKVDRASMAVSLEARTPLLDHRVVEFSWRLPRSLKVRGRSGKRLLRQVLYRRVPAALVDRPKMGFSVPIAAWLRGPLRGWGEDLLSEERLRRGGVLRAAPVRDAWAELQGGRAERALGIWAVLMFQAWQERWGAVTR